MDQDRKEIPASAPPVSPPRPDATHPAADFYRPQRPANGDLSGNDFDLPNVAPGGSYLMPEGTDLRALDPTFWDPENKWDDWE